MENKDPNLEKEIGTTGGITPNPKAFYSSAPSGYVVDPLEPNPELRFPYSPRVFDQMRRTDAQIAANLRAITQPIMGANWDLVSDDDSPEGKKILEFIRNEIGLGTQTKSRNRIRRQGIVFNEHLRDALLCLPFGFSVMEQVYEYSKEDGYHHLRKLAPRPVTTLTDIHVGRDGGLVGVSQMPPPSRTYGAASYKETFIPIKDLVWYVIDKEGSDWTGQSILRAAYKSWTFKTRLEVAQAMALERNGMGIPTITTTESQSSPDNSELQAIVSGLRTGAQSGAVLPPGVQLEIQGVKGSTPDFEPAINRHNQDISKSMLAMHMDLGHDAGARSLGDTFMDQFLTFCQGYADSIAEVFTEHVIRDLVEINFGPEASYPVLVAGDLKANKSVSIADLKALVDSRIIEPDAPLDEHVRALLGIPEADPATARTQAPQAPSVAPEVLFSDREDLSQHIELANVLKDLRADREK